MSEKDDTVKTTEESVEENTTEKQKAAKAFEVSHAKNTDNIDNIDEEALAKSNSTINLEEFKKRSRDDKIRQDKLEDLPLFIQQKATLISAHFLLPAGSKVVDMGCGDGIITYAMALINPRTNFLGIDRDKYAIETAKRRYDVPNLKFSCEDACIDGYKDGSLDGIINSNVLHEVYSEHGYNVGEVTNLLEKQIKKLKAGGTMLIRDYVMPPPDKLVLLEFPISDKKGTTPFDMSNAELLINFSETARPLSTAGCEGFFLEELDELIREDTRLFRLPRKWAIEFLHRKDERKTWQKELQQEYTFFTYDDYRREFSRLGMRMLYASPYWNPWVVKERFRGHFQLYTDDEKPLQPPATNYFLIAQKAGEKGSLVLKERRPLQENAEHIEIVTVRDKKTGLIQELAREPEDFCDIIPYRIAQDGRLLIYVHVGVQRPLVNTVVRGNVNLDGKIWSGHLVEPITMDVADFKGDASANKIAILKYLEKHVGMTARPHGEMDIGLPYFPDPEFIDEVVEPVYIEVRKTKKTKWAFIPLEGVEALKYSEWGYIYELEANDILHAAQIGVLPDPRLEIRVFELMMRLGIEAPKWMGEQMPSGGKARTSINVRRGEVLLDEVEKADFEESKGTPEHLKIITSLFVEEGHASGGKRGLTSQKADFVVTEDGVENIAIVLPLTHGWDDGLLVALDPKMLSVPQRMGGSGAMLTAPSFVLPQDVCTVEEAKQFIANKFGLDTSEVKSLGESYFTHTSITPQRVYPFTVMAKSQASSPAHWKYTAMRRLWILLYCFRCFSGDLLRAVARTHMAMGQEHTMCPEQKAGISKTRNFKLALEKEELYDISLKSEHRIPSRILAEGKYRGQLSLGTDKDIAKKVEEMSEQVDIERNTDSNNGKMRDSFISLSETKNVKAIDKDISSVKKHLKQTKDNNPSNNGRGA